MTNNSLMNDIWCDRTPLSGSWTPSEYLFDSRSEELMTAAIDSIAGLGSNWDGYGAMAFAPEVVQAARVFANAIAEWIPLPAVVPVPNGAIQFEWKVGERELEFELSANGVIRYLKWSPSEGIEEEGEFDSDDLVQSKILVSWLSLGRKKCKPSPAAPR